MTNSSKWSNESKGVSMSDEVEELEARSSEIPKSCGTVITHWQTCSILFIAMQNCKKEIRKIFVHHQRTRNERTKFSVIEVREPPRNELGRKEKKSWSLFFLCTKIPYLLRDFEAFLFQKIKGLLSAFLQQDVCVQSGIFANDLREEYVNEVMRTLIVLLTSTDPAKSERLLCNSCQPIWCQRSLMW